MNANKRNDRAYAKVNILVKGGSSIADALKKVGMNSAAYYKRRSRDVAFARASKKEKDAPTYVDLPLPAPTSTARGVMVIYKGEFDAGLIKDLLGNLQ